jgi:hypothetical protein
MQVYIREEVKGQKEVIGRGMKGPVDMARATVIRARDHRMMRKLIKLICCDSSLVHIHPDTLFPRSNNSGKLPWLRQLLACAWAPPRLFASFSNSTWKPGGSPAAPPSQPPPLFFQLLSNTSLIHVSSSSSLLGEKP